MKFAVCLAFTSLLSAQAPAPTAYSVTQTNSMMGPTVTMQIYRDGSRAVIDQSYPGGHNRSFYNLDTHQNYTWSVPDSSAGCGISTFSGDWGDPFATAASMTGDLRKQNARELPAETINGFATKVYAAAIPNGDAKLWLEPKTGLIAKMEMTPKGGKPQTFIELKSFSLTKPAASVFTMPASCHEVAAPVPPPAATPDMVDATMPPPSANTCSPTFKVVRAGSNTPITTGFQVAIDTTYDVDHPPHYTIGVGAVGHSTFSGGGLHEITAQMRDGAVRIDSAPKYWEMDVLFGDAGSASALIYRQCFGAQPVLLLVLENPAKISDGAQFRWVKP